MPLRFGFRRAVLVAAAAGLFGPWLSAQDAKPVFPGADWERIARPEDVGYSSVKLDALRTWMKTQGTSGLLVSLRGRVLFEYGDVKYVSKIASARKSVLGMLYGGYVASGKIDLRKKVKDAGLEDLDKFLPIEENATLEMLLMARSGIYPPAGETVLTDMPPRRGTQYPGAFFCYQNWDFNAAGTAFEKLTGKNIFDALETDLARPVGMQDFDRARQKKIQTSPEKLESVHPEYAMYLSTRDMARLGLLMLNDGVWNGERLIPEHWVKYLTTLTTSTNDLFPVGFKLSQVTGASRWGYGATWWVWDQPHYPGDLDTGPFDGAYSAMGSGGQYLTVLPDADLVVSHKTEIEGASPGDVSISEYSTILQMLLAARCHGPCR